MPPKLSVFALLALVLFACPHSSLALNRAWDPVVLHGADLGSLLGDGPEEIVGFRYDGGWVQIPVLVDEKLIVDFGAVYDTTALGQTFLTYADPGTFTGADPDPTFDADDEIVFMARDAGNRSLAPDHPAGVIAGSGLEVALFDPLSAEAAWVYLFRSGTLPPGANQQLVQYTFNLLSGDYKTTYDTRSGPNPENSVAATAAYSVHFADRWIRDETAITSGGASGMDLLDRHKSLFAPGVCGRSEDTFSAGEGAFIVNRTGPVRALRGYVGANSGPTTYRVHRFYEQREDIFTALRVHAISSVVDFYDYSANALGMTYFNDFNLGGVVIDGVPDVVAPGQITWEMVTGTPGTMVSALQLVTDIAGFDYTSYYEDDGTPAVTQCTGDAHAYGSSGFFENDPIPNTDPYLGASNIFEATRSLVFGGPGQDLAFAQARAAEVLTPLQTSVSPWSPLPTDVATGDRGRTVFGLAPNPARSATRILFVQPLAGDFEVRVYDVAGRLIATPKSGSLQGGPHALEWNLGSLPAGVYVVTARGADGAWRSKRFVRLR